MKLIRNFHTRAIDQANPNSLSARFRMKRAQLLLKIIEREAERSERVTIVDLGGERGYWNFLSTDTLRKYRLHISIVNLPGRASHPSDEFFDYMEGDACNLQSMASNSFSIAHSNSVIEHVGRYDRMMSFANEIRRLGRSYFVQTPNFWFPLEPHFMTPFFHWLPEPLRVTLIRNFELGNWPKASSMNEAVYWVQRSHLLDRKMFANLFPHGVVRTERFAGMPKSLIAIRE